MRRPSGICRKRIIFCGEDKGVKKMLGMVYFAMHNYKDAKEVFLKVLEQDGSDAEACQYLSRICVAENDLQRGMDFLKQAAAADPNNAETWNDLGALSFSCQDSGAAEQYFLKAIESDDMYALAFCKPHRRLYSYEKNGAAKEMAEKVVDKFPDDPSGLKYLGVVCRMEGSNYEAIRHLLLAMDRDKEDVEIPYNLGLAFMAMEDFESAKDYFEACLSMDPGYSPVKDKLAVCYCKLEGADRAYGLLKRNLSDVDWKRQDREVVSERKNREKISILVPAFNEANKILTNTREIRKHVSGLGYDFEIIVVDDGSDDDTYEILELLSRTIKDVRPYRSTRNKGKGMALRKRP